MQARGGDDLGLGRPRSSLSARSVTPKLDASLGAASGRADGAADETSRAQRAVELLEKKQAARAAPRRAGRARVGCGRGDSCAPVARTEQAS
jgi:hypothetical protein